MTDRTRRLRPGVLLAVLFAGAAIVGLAELATPPPDEPPPGPALRVAKADPHLAAAREAYEAGDVEGAAREARLARDPDRRLTREIATELAKRAETAAEAWNVEEARRLLELGRRADPDAPEVTSADWAVVERLRRNEEAGELAGRAAAAREQGEFAEAERALVAALEKGPAPEVREGLESRLAEVRAEAEAAGSREGVLAQVEELIDRGDLRAAGSALRGYARRSGDGSFLGRADALDDLLARGGAGAYLPARAALRWLVAHQDPKDGALHHETYGEVCGDRLCKGAGSAVFDTAVTGLALLALHAFDPLDLAGEFAEPARKMATWLAGQVAKNGRVPGHSHYSDAIVALALFEWAGPGAGRKAERDAAARILDHFAGPGRLADGAWRYRPTHGTSDTSVTCWVLQALEAGRRAGVEPGLEIAQGGLSYLESCVAMDGGMNYTLSGRPSTDLTAAGLLVVTLFGRKTDEWPRTELRTSLVKTVKHLVDLAARPDQMEKAAAMLWRRWPSYYGWYYATYALRAEGGDLWKAWYPLVEAALRTRQEVKGHLAGSFANAGRWTTKATPLYATAISALILSATYRGR